MKTFLCMVALLAAHAVVVAQKPDVHFGIKGGLNLTKIHGKDRPFDTKAGFHTGGLAHIHLTKHFAIQPEVMYSAQGGQRTIAGNKVITRMNYINIPVLAQYMIGDGFRLQTGPQLGLLVAAKAETNGNKVDIKDGYKTPEFAWVFGASYLTKVGLGFDARYNLGVTPINDGGTPDLRNHVIALGLFYQFMH